MKSLVVVLLAGLLSACAGAPVVQPVPVPRAQRLEQAREEVRATEIAFARSMAVRDHAAFASYLSPEAIFFTALTSSRSTALFKT